MSAWLPTLCNIGEGASLNTSLRKLQRLPFCYQGKGEMLTYFLEGEDEQQRQRRISNTQFKRTSDTTKGSSDSSADIFGAPIIDRKYWPNGTGNVRRGSSRKSLPVSDNSSAVDGNDNCDKCDRLFEDVFTNSTPSDINNVEHINGEIILSDTNPFKPANRRKTSHSGSIEVPFTRSEGSDIIFEQTPDCKLEFTGLLRQLSTDIDEDMV